jgi:hypothetical protein
VTIEELREQGERLCEELGLESYRAGAGLLEATHFQEIYARHPGVVTDDAIEAARDSRALLEWVVECRVGREAAALDDRLHAWEASALVVTLDGDRMPYQSVAVAIANEPGRERRRSLDRARREAQGEPAAIREDRLARERELVERLLGDGYVAARSKLSGIDLEALARSSAEFLAATADMYRDVLHERLRRELEVAPADAERSDSAYLFRGARYDDVFTAADLVPLARKQVAQLGLDAEAVGRVRFDLEDRARKRARAFCAPVRVPDEVHVVIRPHGGYPDYRAFWHELGHALHFANTDRSLDFEARWAGDNSVTEAYAMLFEHMLSEPSWLRRYTGLSGERLERFVQEQAFALLASVRRYAAKLCYEIELFRAGALREGSRRYVPILTEATGFRYFEEDALLDLDDGFYAARYLRAWELEALLADWLREKFDEDWYRNPRAGPVVLDLLSRGQSQDAAALAESVTGAPLSFLPLKRACEAALA